MEHRWGVRLPIRLPVQIGADVSRLSRATMRDVSLSGAYIKTAPTSISRSPLLVRLDLHRLSAVEPLVMRAFTVRRDAAGIGVEWCEFAPDPIRALLASRPRIDIIDLPSGDQALVPLDAAPDIRSSVRNSRSPHHPLSPY